MRTDNHEVIFAIVNSGFAEEAMDVAREQGVRGGTILNARGVAKEDAAAFFYCGNKIVNSHATCRNTFCVYRFHRCGKIVVIEARKVKLRAASTQEQHRIIFLPAL